MSYLPIKTALNLPQLALLLCSMAGSLHAAVKDDPDFAKVVQPFVESHCMDCHDSTTARAGFRIDTLGTDFAAGNTADQWKEVMDNINSGKMPPKKKARPDAKEAFAAASWVAAKLRETELAAQGAGGRVPLRRMNRVEYANTVRDLFTLDANYARRIEKELPADGKVGGFDRGAAGLFMDESQLAQYMAVADMVLGEAVFMEKPRLTKLTWDNTKERYIHGIGVAYRDETGKIVDSNPIPELAVSVPEPLAKVKLDNLDAEDIKRNRYVPHGPLSFAVKNGGIEFLSGGNNYRNPGNLRNVFFPNDWARKGVSRDGWYRFRVQAGAFAGAGAEAQKEVRLVLEYNYGSPIQVVKSVAIDAPLDAPKEYEFLMYLQAGPPDMSRSWELGWDNGGKDVVITNPEYQVPQWNPVLAAGALQEAIVKKKSAQEIAELRQKSEESLAAAVENRKNFPGPMFIYDPKLDIAKRPRLWLGKMEWEGPLVEWPPKGQTALLFAGDERMDDAYLREIFVRFLPRAYRRPATTAEVDGVVGWTLKLKAERQWSFTQAVREGVKNVLCSPQFLYLGSEGAPLVAKPADGPQPVDGWQLANRLSYLLWSSAPDDALNQAAAQNILCDPSMLRAQVKRMIADPKSAEFVRSFTGQWLGVRNFDNGTPPNRDFYKHYDDALRDSSWREPLEFFTEVLRHDLSLLNFISSDFLMVNER
ncbi:MAG: DUF1592 domain-containing protein, partial [Chthoniobacteraceae bacterium]